MEKSYVLIEYLIKHAISLQFLIFISLQFFNFIPKYIEFHKDRSQKCNWKLASVIAYADSGKSVLL